MFECSVNKRKELLTIETTVNDIYENLFFRFPALSECRESIMGAFEILKQSYSNNGKLMVCGNGGSASDSEHIVGELMKGFLLKRRICEKDTAKLRANFADEGVYLAENLQGALPAISLVSQSAISSAFTNDVAADMSYAQQVYGYGVLGDVLMGISTSGKSKNVLNAVKVAQTFGIRTIGLTGNDGGQLKELCDVTIIVPSKATFEIQEYHLPVYHAICAMLEAEFFGANKK